MLPVCLSLLLLLSVPVQISGAQEKIATDAFDNNSDSRCLKLKEFSAILQDWTVSGDGDSLATLGKRISEFIGTRLPHLEKQSIELALLCSQLSTWKEDIAKSNGWRCARASWGADKGAQNDFQRRKLVIQIENLTIAILLFLTKSDFVGFFEQVGTYGYTSDIDTAFVPHPKLPFDLRMAPKLLFDALFCYHLGYTPAYLADTESYLQQVGESLRTEKQLFTQLGRALFAQEQIQAAFIKWRQTLGDRPKSWYRMGNYLITALGKKCRKKALNFAQMLIQIELLHNQSKHTFSEDLSIKDRAMQRIYSGCLAPLQGEIRRLTKRLKLTKVPTFQKELEQFIDTYRVKQALFGSLAESCTSEGYITQGAFRDVVTNRGGQHERNMLLMELQSDLDSAPISQSAKPSQFPRYELSSSLDRFISSLENFFIFDAHIDSAEKLNLLQYQRSWIGESKYAARALKNGISTFDRLLQPSRLPFSNWQKARSALALGQEKLPYILELEQIKRANQISRRAYGEAVFPLLSKFLTPSQIVGNFAKIPLQLGPWVSESESIFLLYEKILRELSRNSSLVIQAVDVEVLSKCHGGPQVRSFPLLFQKKSILTPKELVELNQLAMAYAGISWEFFALAQCTASNQLLITCEQLEALRPVSSQQHDELFAQVANITLKQCELSHPIDLISSRDQIAKFHLDLLVFWIEQQGLFSPKLADFDLNPLKAWKSVFAPEDFNELLNSLSVIDRPS